MLLIACGLARGQDPLAELRQQVATGRLRTPLLSAFEGWALDRAHSTVTNPELLAWLERTPAARRTQAWVWARVGDPAMFARLQRLWTSDAAAVRARPALAFGIAAAWHAGTAAAPARQWESWTEGRQPIPTIEQSLHWYRRHERELSFPIARAPWLLLAFTGLNDVPLDERDWVLQRYRGAKLERLHSAFAEVPYIAGGLDGHPRTLANMVEHGGVCTVNTQYAMSVMRTLGFPATFGGGPGHCWPCWIEWSAGRPQFARSNDLGNRDGTLGQWVTPELRRESDLKRCVAALAQSIDGLRKADCAAAAARAARGPGATRLLVAAIGANPLAASVWRELVSQLREGAAEEAPAKTLLRRMPRALQDHLDVAVRCLSEVDAGGETAGDLPLGDELERCCAALLERAAAAERGDLASALRRLRARIAERHEPPRAAWSHYRDLARAAVAKRDAALLDDALAGAERCARRGSLLDGYRQELKQLMDSCDDPAVLRSVGARRWRLLAEFGDETAARLRLAVLRLPDAAGAAAPDPERTAGGGGGSAFVDRGPGDRPLVGIRWSRGDYHGIPVVGSLQPLFRGGSGELVAGAVHGKVRGPTADIVAPDGFAVAGLAVTSGDVLDGFALVFAPRGRHGPDLDQVRFSSWCGGGDRGQRLLGGPRPDEPGRWRRAIGLRGRSGDSIDALGIVLE